MAQFFYMLREIRIKYSIPTMGIADIIQIIIIAFIIYHAMIFLKKTQAWTLLKGIIVLALLVGLINLLHLNVLYWLVSRSFTILLFIAIIIFQPELRSGLDKIGRKNFVKAIFARAEENKKFLGTNEINSIVQACASMASTKTGAIIAIENEVPLNDFARTGIPIDAKISKQLIVNTFEHNTPLHDGAVIIKGNRIVSATCYFPLSKNIEINKSYGTRHRAAIGVTEITDCICIVVSEETGHISIATRGILQENVSTTHLYKVLDDLNGNYSDDNSNLFKFIKELFKHEKNVEK